MTSMKSLKDKLLEFANKDHSSEPQLSKAFSELAIFAKSKSTIFQKETCKKNSKSSKLTQENLLLFLSFEELSKAFQSLFNPMKFCRP